MLPIMNTKQRLLLTVSILSKLIVLCTATRYPYIWKEGEEFPSFLLGQWEYVCYSIDSSSSEADSPESPSPDWVIGQQEDWDSESSDTSNSKESEDESVGPIINVTKLSNSRNTKDTDYEVVVARTKWEETIGYGCRYGELVRVGEEIYFIDALFDGIGWMLLKGSSEAGIHWQSPQDPEYDGRTMTVSWIRPPNGRPDKQVQVEKDALNRLKRLESATNSPGPRVEDSEERGGCPKTQGCFAEAERPKTRDTTVTSLGSRIRLAEDESDKIVKKAREAHTDEDNY